MIPVYEIDFNATPLAAIRAGNSLSYEGQKPEKSPEVPFLALRRATIVHQVLILSHTPDFRRRFPHPHVVEIDLNPGRRGVGPAPIRV
jgi:hypothetical protein